MKLSSPISETRRKHILRREKFSAFTLIELLTALAVLVILITLLGQFAQISSRLWLDSQASTQSLSRVRGAVDLIADDVINGIFRRNIYCNLHADYDLALIRNAPLSDSNRGVARVAYFFNSTENALVRYYAESARDDVATQGGANDLGAFSSQMPTTVLNGLIAFKCQFRSVGGTLGDVTFFDWDHPNNRNNTATVIISLVVVDDVAFEQLKKTNRLSALTSFLSGSKTATQTWGDYYGGLIGNGASLASMPVAVRSGLRIFEREIPVTITY